MSDDLRKLAATFLEEVGASALTLSGAYEFNPFGLGLTFDIARTFDSDGRTSSGFGVGAGVGTGGGGEAGVTAWFRIPEVEWLLLDSQNEEVY